MANAICSIPECEREIQRGGAARGLCRLHYGRWRRSQGKTRTGNSPCQIDGCSGVSGGPSTAKGYCSKHYTRLLRNGDPLVGGIFDGTELLRHRISDADPETRTGICSVCGPTKVAFRTGRANQCYTVVSQQRKRSAFQDSLRHRDQLLKQYGIDCDEYEALLAEQLGVCAICGGHSDRGRRLSVDHDHLTGAVRGLLCGRCNPAIGLFKDDPALLARAIGYLTK